jgi:hypothetical protein
MFSEPIETASEMTMHLKNSLGMSDVSLYLEQATSGDGFVPQDFSFAEQVKSIQCVDFGYSNEKFLDGINSNAPIEFYLFTQDAYTNGAVVSHFFSELNYNLSIKQGVVTYTEPKPGVGFVY